MRVCMVIRFASVISIVVMLVSCSSITTTVSSVPIGGCFNSSLPSVSSDRMTWFDLSDIWVSAFVQNTKLIDRENYVLGQYIGPGGYRIVNGDLMEVELYLVAKVDGVTYSPKNFEVSDQTNVYTSTALASSPANVKNGPAFNCQPLVGWFSDDHVFHSDLELAEGNSIPHRSHATCVEIKFDISPIDPSRSYCLGLGELMVNGIRKRIMLQMEPRKFVSKVHN